MISRYYGPGRAFASVLSAYFAVFLSFAAAAPQPLFEALEGHAEPAAADSPKDSIVRKRLINIQLSLLNKLKTGKENEVSLNAFGDADYNAKVNRVSVLGPKSFIISGSVNNDPKSTFFLSTVEDTTIGNIKGSDGSTFEIRFNGTNHEMREVNYGAYPSCGGCDDAAGKPFGTMDRMEAAHGDAVESDSSAYFDVMILYTPAAKTAAGGESAMNALINLAVEETNTIYSNSLINSRVRLVHSAETTYTEVDSATDLSRLRSTSDGHMDEAHTLRDTYGADIVCLFYVNNSSCGRAYRMLTHSTDFAWSAFSVVSWNCATGYYSFAHEIGHNMGCHHAVGDAGLTRATSILYSYAYGWRFNSDADRTVMAYSPGTRRMYFSNPNVSYGGEPTGVAFGDPDEAYNTLCINNSANIVANWRQTKLTDPESVPTLSEWGMIIFALLMAFFGMRRLKPAYASEK